MRLLKITLIALVMTFLLCSSSATRDFQKLKIADGYVQVDNVNETKIYLEVSVYNASTEYVTGIVTVMKAPNLSSNRKVINIAPGKSESVMFPKADKDKIVTWEEIKLHDFAIKR